MLIEALELFKSIEEDLKPTPEKFLELAKKIDSFATLNYSKKKINNALKVEQFLNNKGLLTPVTTESKSSRYS